jgi:dCTP deaminase
MSIKSDKWIRRMAQEHGMIEPFVERQVRGSDDSRVISYGVSSYGYDVRCTNHFKVFTNINSAIVDPKNFDAGSFVDIHSDVCIIPELLRPGQHRRILPHSAQRIDHLPG